MKCQVTRRQQRCLDAQKGGKLSLRPACGHLVLAHEDGGPSGVVQQRGDQVRAVDLRGAGDARRAVFFHAREQPPVIRQRAQQVEKLFHKTSETSQNQGTIHVIARLAEQAVAIYF